MRLRRYPPVRQPEGSPDLGGSRRWTEVTLTEEDLAHYLGLAPGTKLMSVSRTRDACVIITVEEPLEAHCEESGEGSSAG